MAHLLLLTQTAQSSIEILPALSLLHHQIKVLPASADIPVDARACSSPLAHSATRCNRHAGPRHFDRD